MGKMMRMASSGVDTVSEAFKTTAADIKNHGAFGAIQLVAKDVKELILESAQSVSNFTAPLNPWSDSPKPDTTESADSPPKFAPAAKAVLKDIERSISSFGGWLSDNLGITQPALPSPIHVESVE